ncbi:chemotaxis protein CheW [Nitrosopumilus sp. b3]|uniref:chemotaxis protein CheW n=1 Tax=Nitrosopumilus sp. b3 TaxID=2109909 RepID=UPI0015F5AC8E|nr:chemotaxis protein CheW [Nitrosopumilus sp. b3]KAF6247054.1 chemotaxis protein CheW [Nitrosopumilus sp. b3]
MPEDKTSNEMVQVVTFAITEESTKKGNYAIPIEHVKEIKTLGPITNIPKSKSYVKGVMNLRGKIIPVIDVNGKLGISGSKEHIKQRILVTDIDNVLTGLLVDEVNEVLRLDRKDIEIAPLEAFEDSRYISGIAKVNEKLYVILDTPKFLEENANDVLPKDTSQELSIENEKEDSIPEIEEMIKQEIHN